MRPLAIALIHFPVLDKEKRPITTAVTNVDVHDLSRSARCYGVTHSYYAHPVEAQQVLMQRVIDHWTAPGGGAKRIPTRQAALSRAKVVSCLQAAAEDFEAVTGDKPEIWTTAAKSQGEITSFGAAREALHSDGPPVILVFGTGWGLTRDVIDGADVRVEPVVGLCDWNHLSVRAACAIILDRLCAPSWQA